ncbi:MAG: class I SAM-dependent methyltransferase [Bacteroidota bacterium]
MHYFISESTARRYAQGRPYFHETTIDRIREKIALPNEEKLEQILDVACGTGLSTKALKKLGDEIVGIDNSEEMLRYAEIIPGIRFIQTTAESLPFVAASFDMITVSSAIHWFNIDRFLAEGSRVLKKEGWLILYENYFLFDMQGDSNFKSEFSQHYLGSYPSPPRNSSYNWNNENLARFELQFVAEDRFKNDIVFDQKSLILYFTTQSNITSAITEKGLTYPEIETALSAELRQYFPTEETKRTFSFGNTIKYFKRL